jgi:hypothetical protein
MITKFWHNAVGLEDKKQKNAHLRQAGKIDPGDKSHAHSPTTRLDTLPALRLACCLATQKRCLEP